MLCDHALKAFDPADLAAKDAADPHHIEVAPGDHAAVVRRAHPMAASRADQPARGRTGQIDDQHLLVTLINQIDPDDPLAAKAEQPLE